MQTMATELRCSLLADDLLLSTLLLPILEPLNQTHFLVQGTAAAEGVDVVQIDVLWKVSLTEKLVVAHN